MTDTQGGKIRQGMKLKTRMIMGVLSMFGVAGCAEAQPAVEIGPGLSESWQRLEQTLRPGVPRNYYAVSFASNGCNFEIWVNGLKVAEYFDSGGFSGMVPINSYILKSGQQRIKVRLFPVKGHEEKGILSTEPLWIELRSKPDPSGDLDTYKTFLANFIPAVPVGQPYFEYETTFDAEVPYELQGWGDCEDLRNDPDLKAEVAARMAELGNLLLERNFRVYSDQEAVSLAETSFSFYLPYEEAEQEMRQLYESVAEGKYTRLKPMDDSKLVFYGDGRLVSLEYPKIKGYGLILEKGDKEGFKLPLLLGRRKGSDRLEIIAQMF